MENHPNIGNNDVQNAWEQNAAFWDAHMGDGNLFQRVLIGPATERLLSLCPDETVLDVACGNGVFARRMAHLNAQVVACDFSASMITLAKARSAENPEHAERIEYHVIDATDEAQLLSLGQQRFDAAVCNMALMDMAEIRPLLRALNQLLKPQGRFVFSVMHPCFNSGSALVAEEEDRDGHLMMRYAVKVSQYAHLSPVRGLGMVGQPVPHYYFYRPLHVLLNECFQCGLMIDGLEEPTFGEQESSTRLLSWANFKEIPPVLIARLRLLS